MRVFLISIASAVLVGCGGSKPHVDASGPPVFEVRDFTVREKSATEFGTTFDARGTVVTKDPRHQKGVVVLLLYVDIEKNEKGATRKDEDRIAVVLVRDGTGTFESTEYIGGKEALPPKFSNWRAIGIAPLLEAAIAKN